MACLAFGPLMSNPTSQAIVDAAQIAGAIALIAATAWAVAKGVRFLVHLGDTLAQLVDQEDVAEALAGLRSDHVAASASRDALRVEVEDLAIKLQTLRNEEIVTHAALSSKLEGVSDDLAGHVVREESEHYPEMYALLTNLRDALS